MQRAPWRVVILEDDLDTRTFFERCIAAHPQLELCASCATLSEARDWFQSASADVFLTDLALPDGQGLSVHTVQSHVKSLYARLAVHSRGEAVFEASRMGLLTSMRSGA